MSGAGWKCSSCKGNNTNMSALCSICGTAKPYGGGAGPGGAPGGGGAWGQRSTGGGAAQLVAASAGGGGDFSGGGGGGGLPIGNSPSRAPGASPLGPGPGPSGGDPSAHSGGAYGGGKAPPKAGPEQLTYLHSVVDQSKQYGVDIERSVEELAQLLHKKTVECEGLRAIASENYSGLRESVRHEYESRIRSESRQIQEKRAMQTKLEGLQVERNQLMSEVESLRDVVAKMEALPPNAPYSPNDNSFFNRVLRTGDGEGNNNGAPRPTGGEDGNPAGMMKSVNTWQMANKDYVPEGSQRELINYINNLDHEHAKALHASGTFDFMKSAMVRLCSPLPNGTYPDLPTVVGQLIRERRDDPAGFSNDAQTHAIPAISRDAYTTAAEVFLMDNPGQHEEWQRLCDIYHGNQQELFSKVHRDHETKRGFQNQVQGSGQGALEGKAAVGDGNQNNNLELNARVVLMYRMYNPTKLNGKELNDMLAKYPPEVLLSALIEKYGPEPTAQERRDLIKGMVQQE